MDELTAEAGGETEKRDVAQRDSGLESIQVAKGRKPTAISLSPTAQLPEWAAEQDCNPKSISRTRQLHEPSRAGRFGGVT